MTTVSLQFNLEEEQEKFEAAKTGLPLKRTLQSIERYLIRTGKDATLDRLEDFYGKNGLPEYKTKLIEMRRR